MNCQEVRERLPALIDGELPPEELAEVENHLAGCKNCQDERHRQEKFTTSVKVSLEGLKPSDFFVKGVLDKLPAAPPSSAGGAPAGDEEAAAKRKTMISLLAAVLVIVAALVALGIVAVFKRRGGAEHAPKPPEKSAPAPVPSPNGGARP